MMKRIGILGGTFNPVHIGHLAIAQTAQEKFNLDKVVFVPSNYPPHKRIRNLASARDRFQMVRLAIKNNPLFEISDFEISREGKSYTVDTLQHFCSVYPGKTKFFCIIGGDSFSGLRSWKKIDAICEMTSFIVVNRSGYAGRKKGDRPLFSLKKSRKIGVCPLFFCTMPGIDISSSYIRKRIVGKKSVKYFVPEGVLKYINQHKLYKTLYPGRKGLGHRQS